MLETVTIKDIDFWDTDNKCMDGSYLSPNHFNIPNVIKDIANAGYIHPYDYDSDLDSDEFQGIWSTNIEVGNYFILSIVVEEVGKIDENTKWFYQGKQVYPVEE